MHVLYGKIILLIIKKNNILYVTIARTQFYILTFVCFQLDPSLRTEHSLHWVSVIAFLIVNQLRF